MPSTANGLVYPVLGGANNPPGDVQALGVSVDARYGLSVTNYTDLASISTPYLGMRVWVTALGGHCIWNGTNWLEPDRTGTGTFTAASHAANGLVTYTIAYGFTRQTTPVDVDCQIAGFVSNSSPAVIKGVVAITTTNFGLAVLNSSASAMSFTNLPVRFRVSA